MNNQNPVIDTSLVSRTGKKEDAKPETNTVLFSADFAVSVYMTQHNQILYSYVHLFSEIGGLGGAIYALLHVIGRYLNHTFMYNKITRALYFASSKVG